MRSLWIITLVMLMAALLTYGGLKWRAARSRVPAHEFALRTGELREWSTIGGNWKTVDGVMYNESHERGAKILAGAHEWRDYTLSAEMRFTGDNADMGLAVRVINETKGVDTYDGYYVGLRTLDGTLVIGRSHYGWAEAKPVPLPGGVHSGVWYRMRVTSVGCHMAASVENLETQQTAWMAVEDSNCVRAGRVALRSLNAGAMWRRIRVQPATEADYDEVARHAATVERPEFPPTPPWWTAEHTTIALALVFLLALLLQLVYFRVLRWKTLLITGERERLALEIHDTMAQSFAGIGYQIQGIRNSVQKIEQRETGAIVEQLDTAYLLVRNCHIEASRTISMLSSFAPEIQDLMESLRETATRITGGRVKIVSELEGTVFPLPLRMGDALLHIGQEAIANAAHHAAPGTIKLRMGYSKASVQLEVIDNGCGFNYRAESAGLGLLGMQRRAHEVAGVLEISSRPGAGTRVKVSVRVKRPQLFDRMRRALGLPGKAE